MDEVACKKSQPEAMVMMAPPRAVAEISWLLLFIVRRQIVVVFAERRVQNGFFNGIFWRIWRSRLASYG